MGWSHPPGHGPLDVLVRLRASRHLDECVATIPTIALRVDTRRRAPFATDDELVTRARSPVRTRGVDGADACRPRTTRGGPVGSDVPGRCLPPRFRPGNRWFVDRAWGRSQRGNRSGPRIVRAGRGVVFATRWVIGTVVPRRAVTEVSSHRPRDAAFMSSCAASTVRRTLQARSVPPLQQRHPARSYGACKRTVVSARPCRGRWGIGNPARQGQPGARAS